MRGLDGDLDAIYLKHVGPIRGYLRRLSGDAELAGDLTQEVFYRAMRQLYRIARNLYLDHSRRGRVPTASLDDLSGRTAVRGPSAAAPPVTPEALRSTLGRPEDELLRRERRDGVLAAVGRLPENQRTVLLLRDVDGLSYEEIALAMDMTAGAVKSCLHRARRRFVEVYLERGE
jgi:RNA polymerase sigma-70 factor (ECF subfamily)